MIDSTTDIADYCVCVIGLQSTGESGTDKFIEQGLWDGKSMISSAGAFLHHVVCFLPNTTARCYVLLKPVPVAATDPQNIQGW